MPSFARLVTSHAATFLPVVVALHGRLGAQEVCVTLKQFLGKQFIDVIQWNEAEDGMLAYRYPMLDMEIQNGGQLTVRESQMAAFVNEGKIADILALACTLSSPAICPCSPIS